MMTLPVLTKNTETWRILLHSHRVAANTGNSSTFANVTWRSTLRPSLHVTFVQLASGNRYDLSPSISVKRGPRKTSRSQSRWSTEAETSDWAWLQCERATTRSVPIKLTQTVFSDLSVQTWKEGSNPTILCSSARTLSQATEQRGGGTGFIRTPAHSNTHQQSDVTRP